MSNEYHLENLLEGHPYLLAKELGRLRPIRQLRKGRSRLDLLFLLKTGYCIVELKKTTLSPLDGRQIAEYCRLLQKQKLPLTHHYLVGFRPANLAAVTKEIGRYPFKIRLRFLGEGVPLSVLWDSKLRRYVPYNPDLLHLGECFHLRL